MKVSRYDNMALCRYDNPGSVHAMPADKNAETSALKLQESLSVARIRDKYDEVQIPLDAPYPAGIPTALKIEMTGTALAVRNSGQADGVKGLRPSKYQGVGTLEYEQSAMRGEDVATFFQSLDDNCVWHLHHLDQVSYIAFKRAPCE